MNRKGQMPYQLPDNEIVTAYLAGDSLRVIAERLNVSHELIRHHLKYEGIQLRERAPRKYFPIPCKTCGTLFTPRTETARFHCRACIKPAGRPKQDFCKRGHPMTPENMYPSYGSTPARCRQCVLEHMRTYYERKTHG